MVWKFLVLSLFFAASAHSRECSPDEVYVFLENKSRMWTVWTSPRGKMLFHTPSLTLKDAVFIVDEQRRRRVVSDNYKYPHAGVCGKLVAAVTGTPKPIEIRYTPFESNSFFEKETLRPLQGAKFVQFHEGGTVFGYGLKRYRKFYTLLNAKGLPFLSPVKGELGGYAPKKIFGSLDCPSALSWIARGHYVNHRVFFASADDARAAGYRPCANCQPELHSEWKKKLVALE